MKMLRERWIQLVTWTKQNPTAAILLFSAGVLVVLQIIRTIGQYKTYTMFFV